MFISSKHAYLTLRIGLAVVFLWWGMDLFRHPQTWSASAWPSFWLNWFTRWGLLDGARVAYLGSVLAVLIGLSLLLQIFHKFFALLATLWLIAMLITSGVNATNVRDFALIGSLLSVLLWPAPRERY